MGVRAVRGCSKTSGAKILIKINMIYSNLDPKEQGQKTEHSSPCLLFIGGRKKKKREKNVLPGKNRAGMDHATP